MLQGILLLAAANYLHHYNSYLPYTITNSIMKTMTRGTNTNLDPDTDTETITITITITLSTIVQINGFYTAQIFNYRRDLLEPEFYSKSKISVYSKLNGSCQEI